MKQFTACVFGAGLLVTTGAFAQSSEISNRFYIIGYGELGYFDRRVIDSSQYRIDVDMGIAPTAGSSGLGFGFSLGIDAYGESGIDDFALYPAIELGTGYGKFSAGIPRSVLDRGYLPEPKFGNSTRVSLEFRGVEASALGLLHLTGSDAVWGLRYDGAFSSTKVGVSYHHMDGVGSDMEFYALAVNHTFSGPSSLADFMIYAGVEHLAFGITDDTSYRIGVEGYADKITAGLSYTDKGFPFGVKLATLYMDYAVLDDLTLTGSYGHVNTGAGRNIYGLGAQYDFLENAYVKASYVDTDAAGSDPFIEIMMGWKF
ncbi:hypothetical protein [Profundibacter sp.]